MWPIQLAFRLINELCTLEGSIPNQTVLYINLMSHLLKERMDCLCYLSVSLLLYVRYVLPALYSQDATLFLTMQIHYRNVLLFVCLNYFAFSPLHLCVALEILVIGVPNRFILNRFNSRTSFLQLVLLFSLKKYENCAMPCINARI